MNNFTAYHDYQFGRPVTPMDESERPTFLPGDKCRDKRDVFRTLWRVVRRFAVRADDYITLRKVDDATHEMTMKAKSITPFLEMVTPRKAAGECLRIV